MPQTVSVIQCILWAAVSSWYYGYHLSELNFPVASLTCSRGSTTFGLPDCLPVTDAHYSIITAVYTIGGLCGSLGSSYVVQRVGLAGGIAWSGWSNLASALIMGLSWHWVMVGFGRFVAGVSSGIAICLVPPYLAQLAKTTPQLSQRSGLIGSMHQVGIVTGLFVAQVVAWIATGERGDLPGRWRVVVLLSGAVSVWQVWAAKRVGMTRAAVSSDPIAGYASTASGEETGQEPVLGRDSNEASEPLLAGSSTDISSPTQQLALRDLLSSPTLRGPTVLCATILALQQLSGVNAVMFYSTPVLKPLLPASAALIGLGITGVNALMTLPAVFLIDTVGRKRLLLYSVVAMGSLSALLAYGLDGGHQGISALAIVAFIGAFAVGLGPVPWLFVSELVPQQAIPALSALSLSTSWILNFFIALLFLPLRDALSEPDPAHPGGARINEGRVFYVFFCTCGVLAGIVYRWLPKDK